MITYQKAKDQNYYGFIYETTCKIDNSIYVGQRKFRKRKSTDDQYLGSGLLICKKIKKHGRENFKRRIIEFCLTADILNEREKYYVDYYKNKYKDKCLNINDGGLNGTAPLKYHPNKKEIYKKIADKNRGRPGSKGMLNKKHSESTKKKMSEAKIDYVPWNKGLRNHLSKETIEKMSIAGKNRDPWNKGKKLTDDQKKNIYKFPKGNTPWNKNKKLSKDIKEKISNTLIYLFKNKENHPMYGKVHTDKTKEKISKANKGNIPPNRKKIYKIKPESNRIIKVYNCTREAIKDGYPSCRRAIKNGKIYKGYYWKHKIK